MSVWGDIVRCVIDFLKKKICMTTKAVIEKKQLKKLVMQKQSIKKKNRQNEVSATLGH